MEILSRVHAKNLVRWAKDRPEVLVLSADLTSSTEIDLFKETYPDRFISLGVAEQNMLSFAGGLAREGFLPFIHTFAVFIYRRAYDQMAMSVAYPCLPVRMFGFLPGITSPGGASHQAIEDIAMMRSLPNMTVVEVADATEIETILDAIEEVPGPVYVRMLRGEVPRLFPADEPLQLENQPRVNIGRLPRCATTQRVGHKHQRPVARARAIWIPQLPLSIRDRPASRQRLEHNIQGPGTGTADT